MKIGDLNERAVWRTRIELGAELNPPGEPGDLWVVLREPTYAEAMTMMAGGNDSARNVEATSKMLDSLIVEHNVEGADGKPADVSKVADIIRGSANLFTVVVRRWQEALPLVRKSREN